MNFTNDWFEKSAQPVWDNLIGNIIKPRTILEIGAYEGKSICYLIDKLGRFNDLEIHAIDSWQGGKDYRSKDINALHKMSDVEDRFHANTKEVIAKSTHKIKLHSHKDLSEMALSKLVAKGEFKDFFDFIYVDGSHETTETLSDLVLAFKLLRPGGTVAIDDYLWFVDDNPDFRPKLAIDAFVNLHLSKIHLAQAVNSQVYIVKKKHEPGGLE